MKSSPIAKIIASVALVAALTFGSLSAFAADPEPVATDKTGQASETDAKTQTGRSSVEKLDVNQAELEAAGGQGFDSTTPAPTLRPMTAEIKDVLEQSRQQVTALQESFAREPNADAALAINRRIEQLKITAELDILRIQARYARQDGNEDLASRIESDITTMTTPRPQKQPIERPATDADNR